IAIPWLLAHRWSWLRGWVSRRTLAVLVAVLLAIRAVKVGAVAVHGGATVAAPWGGEITFQAGAVVFLALTLVAPLLVARAAALASGKTEPPGSGHRPAHPGPNPVPAAPMHRTRSAPRPGPPRSKPVSRPPMQRNRSAPRPGHPRLKPVSRTPMQ